MMSEHHTGIEFDWVGAEVRRQPLKVIHDAEHYVRTAHLDFDRNRLPLGSEFSDERIGLIKAVGKTIIEFADVEFGVGDVQPLTDASQGYIRFYDPEDYAKASKTLGFVVDSHGFKTDHGLVGVLEVEDEGINLYRTLHELLHNSAYKRYAMQQDFEAGRLNVGLRHAGVANHGKVSRFMALDEGMIVSLTDKVKDTQWPKHELLAPYADVRNPLLGKKEMAQGGYPMGIVFASIFKVMCERASQVVGKDVEDAFYKAHFGGGQESLRYLSKTFDNPAVIALSHLGNDSKEADIDAFLETARIGREPIIARLEKIGRDATLDEPSWRRRLGDLILGR